MRPTEIASRLASVPELVKRTRSSPKRSHTARAKLRLGQVGAAEVDAGVQRSVHRGADHRMRVAVDAGGVFAQEVDVLGAVEVPQPAALAARDAERERRVVQHGARVAAGHHRGRLDEAGQALRVARDVGFLGLGQRRVDVGVAQFRLAHGVLRSVGASLPGRQQPVQLRARRRFTTEAHGAGGTMPAARLSPY